MIFFQISIHSGTTDHCLCGSMSTGICKYDMLISILSQDSCKSSHDNRMCDHCFLYLCLLEQVRLQQNLCFLWNQCLHSSQKIQTLFQQAIDFFLIIFSTWK